MATALHRTACDWSANIQPMSSHQSCWASARAERMPVDIYLPQSRSYGHGHRPQPLQAARPTWCHPDELRRQMAQSDSLTNRKNYLLADAIRPASAWQFASSYLPDVPVLVVSRAGGQVGSSNDTCRVVTTHLDATVVERSDMARARTWRMSMNARLRLQLFIRDVQNGWFRRLSVSDRLTGAAWATVYMTRLLASVLISHEHLRHLNGWLICVYLPLFSLQERILFVA